MRRRATAINLAFTWAGTAVLVLQGLIVTPLYARAIPLGLLGAWMVSGNVVAWLLVIDPNISRILQQRVAHAMGRGDQKEMASLVAAGNVIGYGVGLGLCIAALMVPAILSVVPGVEAGRAEIEAAVMVSVIASGVQIAAYSPWSASLGMMRTGLAGSVTVAASCAGLFATLYGLVSGWGLGALSAGMLARAVVLFVCHTAVQTCVAWKYGSIRFSPPRSTIKSFFRPSAYSLAEKGGSAMASQFELLGVALTGGASATAQIAITGKPFEPLRLITDRVFPAMSPALSHLAGERGVAAVVPVLRHVILIHAGVTSLAIAAITVGGGPLIRLWTGPASFGGYGVLALVAVAAVAASLSVPSGEILYATGGIRAIAIGRLIEGVARVVCQSLLGILCGAGGVLLGGIVGTVIATAVWTVGQAEISLGVKIGTLRIAYLKSLAIACAGVLASAAAGALLFGAGQGKPNPGELVGAVAACSLVGACGIAFWPGLMAELLSHLRGLSVREREQGSAQEKAEVKQATVGEGREGAAEMRRMEVIRRMASGMMAPVRAALQERLHRREVQNAIRMLGRASEPDEEEVFERVREERRAAGREAVASARLRIFLVYYTASWEQVLPSAFARLGDVIPYDWRAHGFRDDLPGWARHRPEMNAALLRAYERALERGHVDVVVGYMSGRTVSKQTVRELRGSGTTVINFCWDDILGFFGGRADDEYTGPAEIAREVSLNVTNAPESLVKYRALGARAVFAPEAADPELHKPYEEVREIDVSFVGQCYGWRPAFIRALGRRGIRVECFGPGWPNGALPEGEMVRLYSRSRVNLGFGGVGRSRKLCCLKGRDFEVPMSGGFYVTQENPDLHRVYEVGREILTYRDVDECAGIIRWALENDEKATEVRLAGRQRALRDHTYEVRWGRLFEKCGLLARYGS